MKTCDFCKKPFDGSPHKHLGTWDEIERSLSKWEAKLNPKPTHPSATSYNREVIREDWFGPAGSEGEPD